MKLNKKKRGVAVMAASGLVFAGIVVPAGGAFADTTDDAVSQLSGGEAFLAGDYLELGIRPNGSFGSTSSNVPAGFHPQESALGMVVIRDLNAASWAAADTAGSIDGDFFVPGTPYEGWTMKVGSSGTVAANNHDDSDIPGSLGSVVDATTAEGNNTAIWTATNAFDGLNIVINYSVPETGQRIDAEVVITNNSGAAIDDIFWGRGVDPDNTQEEDDTFTSTNRVSHQMSEGDDFTAVSAFFPGGAALTLWSDDERSVAARESDDFTEAFDPEAVFAGTGAFVTEVGDEATEDAGINLAFKIESLANGASTTLTWSYFLAGFASLPGGGEDAGPAGFPGITLDVAGPVGRVVDHSPVYYGADRVAAESDYMLTLMGTSRIAPYVLSLAEGELGVGGSLREMVRLPALPAGTYKVVMTGTHRNGATLELTSQFTVGDSGEFTGILTGAENLQVIK